jgi:holo-[acyl-carrier protein] synthase
MRVTSLAVGTDLVEVARIRSAIEADAPRFAQRIFTAEEQAYCESRPDRYASFAARFAAKEALRKIFGQWGFDDVVWTETEITSGADGAPAVCLHGTAGARAKGYAFAISLSHAGLYAQAFCVAYREQEDE